MNNKNIYECVSVCVREMVIKMRSAYASYKRKYTRTMIWEANKTVGRPLCDVLATYYMKRKIQHYINIEGEQNEGATKTLKLEAQRMR